MQKTDPAVLRKDGETNAPAEKSKGGDISAFIEAVKALGPRDGTGRGRLVFALDATMSRQPTWDMACGLQADMFKTAEEIGGLDVQLVYFRGHNECQASKWASDPGRLAGMMSKIDCRGGHTQIQRVLRHVAAETEATRVHALVFVGDAMEEKVDDLCAAAGELGLRGVPIFIFQEGDDGATQVAFREMARLSRGAYGKFGPGSARELGALLKAAATYAAGGFKALEAAGKRGDAGAALLLEQMKG